MLLTKDGTTQIDHIIVSVFGVFVVETKMPDNVTYGGGYAHYIKSKTTTVLSKHDINEITQKIESNRLAASYKTNRDHTRHVKDIINRRESKASFN